MPQFVLGARTGAPVTNEVLTAYGNGAIRRLSSTQASDLVRDLLQSVGQRFAVGDSEFTELIHRTEALVCATIVDHERDNSRDYSLAQNWVGGDTATERYAAEGLGQRMLAELESDGPRWWPLGTGLFGSDQTRLHARRCPPT